MVMSCLWSNYRNKVEQEKRQISTKPSRWSQTLCFYIGWGSTDAVWCPVLFISGCLGHAFLMAHHRNAGDMERFWRPWHQAGPWSCRSVPSHWPSQVAKPSVSRTGYIQLTTPGISPNSPNAQVYDFRTRIA